MTERRIIKQRSPAVWARVKEAYLAGEPAASVARRFDVGVGNLRYRANAEGWTRRAHLSGLSREEDCERARIEGRADDMRAPIQAGRDRSLDSAAEEGPGLGPREQLIVGLRRAARKMAQGRAAEAEALIRAARALVDLTGDATPSLEEMDAVPDGVEALHRAVEHRAWAILADLWRVPPLPPVASEAFYFHLRDRHHLEADGYEGDQAWVATHRPDLLGLWNAEGRVPEPPPPSDEETRVIVSALTLGVRQREEGDLKAWIREVYAAAEAPLPTGAD